MQAWDFSGTSQQRLQLNVWVNDTSNQENLSGQQPPNSLRINKVQLYCSLLPAYYITAVRQPLGSHLCLHHS